MKCRDASSRDMIQDASHYYERKLEREEKENQITLWDSTPRQSNCLASTQTTLLQHCPYATFVKCLRFWPLNAHNDNSNLLSLFLSLSTFIGSCSGKGKPQKTVTFLHFCVFIQNIVHRFSIIRNKLNRVKNKMFLVDNSFVVASCFVFKKKLMQKRNKNVSREPTETRSVSWHGAFFKNDLLFCVID